MAGYSTHAGEKEGITIHKDGIEIFLDKIECGRLKDSIAEARREYWKRFRLAPMKLQRAGA